jgi:hypothetical protein
MKLNYGAKRHHYSMFNVGRSMFDVLFLALSVEKQLSAYGANYRIPFKPLLNKPF